jgi:hypothetical protein
MNDRFWVKVNCLVKKDFLIGKSKIRNILLLYGLYIAIIVFSLSQVKKFFASTDSLLPFIFLNIFGIQIIYLMTSMLLPLLVYSESMKEKHEMYFAYRYSIFEIIFGKSIVLCIFSLLPSYIALIVLFPLIKLSFFTIIDLVIIIPALSAGLIALNVLLIWFSKIGKMFSMLFLVLLIFSISQVRSMLTLALRITQGDIVFMLSVLAAALWAVVFTLSKVIKKEKCILKL